MKTFSSYLLLIAIIIATAASSILVEALSEENYLYLESQKAKKMEEIKTEHHYGAVYRDILHQNRDHPYIKALSDRNKNVGTKNNNVGSACGSCTFSVGLILDVLLSKDGVNVTVDSINATICAKKFPKKEENEICVDVARVVIKFIAKEFNRAKTGGWSLTNDICYDILKECTADCCKSPYTPEQLSLSFAETNVLSADNMKMRVTWMTLNKTTGDFIAYKDASSTTWTKIPSTDISQDQPSGLAKLYNFYGYFHSGVMISLKPNTTYSYFVGSTNGAGFNSTTYSFTTLPLTVGTPAFPFKVATVADMGTRNSENTMSQISKLVDSGEVQAVMMVGDLGYTDGFMGRASEFATQIEDFATKVPLITICGNHDTSFIYNFSFYRHRYVMPSAGANAPSDAMFYALNIGPVNIIQTDTETFFDSPDITEANINWMKKALAKADSTSGTFTHVNQHRPFYCSSGKSCMGKQSEWLRMEAEYIYYSNHVDFVFAGHVHNLETMYPIVESKLAGAKNFTFPTAPTYMVGGNAGQDEDLSSFKYPAQPWDRVRQSIIGYQTFEYVQKRYPQDGNKLHTSCQVTAFKSSDNTKLDEFTIVSRR